MSKKHKSPPKGSDTVSKWGSMYGTTFYNRYRFPWGGTDYTTVNAWSVYKDRTSTVVNPLIGGWRYPSAHRAYCFLLVPGGGYSFKDSTGVEYFGDQGFPRALDIFVGSSGAGRYPRTSLNCQNRAITEALNKLSDGVMNVAESLATMNQTFDLIANALRAMLRLYDLVKGRVKFQQTTYDTYRSHWARDQALRASKHKKILPWAPYAKRHGVPRTRPSSSWFPNKDSYWLELMYGWLPLVGDIAGYLQLIRSLPVPRVSAVRNVEENETLPSGPTIRSVSGEIRSGAKARFDAELTSPGLAMLNSLSLVNPFSLAWELLPFSFVIDWLLPIGNCISALTASMGLTKKGSSLTTYTKTSLSVQEAADYVSGSPMSYNIESLTMNRIVALSWTPRLYIRSPFRLARSVTALALLRQIK